MRRWEVAGEALLCCVKNCGREAVHVWGGVDGVPFCCEHFTDLVIEIFDMREAVFTRIRQDALAEYERRVRNIIHHHNHLDAVQEYERRAQRKSVIDGKKCEGEDEKDQGAKP